MIDKDELESEFNLTQVKLNETKDLKIESDCINSHKKLDCNDVLFEENLEYTCLRDDYQLYIKLNYENLEEKEFEESLIKLFSDLMNLLHG